MFLGSVVSYMKVKAKTPGSEILDTIGTIPYAIPGIVIGVSMILAWSVGPIVLYGTIWIMLMAYVMRYLPSSLRSSNATLQQIDNSLEEAARTSGASWLDAFKDIVLPLLRPGMLAGWILVFMPAFRELTISVLLWSIGTETVGVATFELQDAGYKEIAAALACIVMAVALVGDSIIWRIRGWVERAPT
jgi:iron(III) transport system permease protein